VIMMQQPYGKGETTDKPPYAASNKVTTCLLLMRISVAPDRGALYGYYLLSWLQVMLTGAREGSLHMRWEMGRLKRKRWSTYKPLESLLSRMFFRKACPYQKQKEGRISILRRFKGHSLIQMVKIVIVDQEHHHRVSLIWALKFLLRKS
jgi:hypothetical protein